MKSKKLNLILALILLVTYFPCDYITREARINKLMQEVWEV